MEKLAELLIYAVLIAALVICFIEPLFLKLICAKLFGIPVSYLRAFVATLVCVFGGLIAGFVIRYSGLSISAEMSWGLGSLVTRAATYGGILKDRETGVSIGFGLGLIVTVGIALIWVGIVVGGIYAIGKIT